MEDHVILIVGLFIIGTIAAALSYGVYPLITCVIGLCVFAMLFRLFCGDA